MTASAWLEWLSCCHPVCSSLSASPAVGSSWLCIHAASRSVFQSRSCSDCSDPHSSMNGAQSLKCSGARQMQSAQPDVSQIDSAGQSCPKFMYSAAGRQKLCLFPPFSLVAYDTIQAELCPCAAHAVQGLGAEVVVALDACTEHGDQFMTTHSYLPSEIHWGFTFCNIIKKAEPPSTHHTVDIGKWGPILSGLLLQLCNSLCVQHLFGLFGLVFCSCMVQLAHHTEFAWRTGQLLSVRQ